METGNVEVVRTVYEALNRNDLPGAIALMTEDVEYVNPPYAVEPGTRHGHDGMMTALENLRAPFSEFAYAVRDLEDCGDRVLASVVFQVRSRAQAVDIAQDRHHVWTLRDGKIARFQWFSSRDEARAATG